MKNTLYLGLLIFITGCSSQELNPPKRLQIENQSKIVIHDFRLNGNDTILIQNSEEIYDSCGNIRESVFLFNEKMAFSDIRLQKIFSYDSLNNNIEIIESTFDDSFEAIFMILQNMIMI